MTLLRNIKNGIQNFWHYRKIVWRHRDWDYGFILEMMKFQITDLATYLEKYGWEVDEGRLPKIAQMKRVIELLENERNDNFAERCGWKLSHFDWKKREDGTYELIRDTSEISDEELSAIFKAAQILEDDEWKECMNLLKDIKTWWD